MKLLKGIITSILLSQIIFLMIPFNIHADTTTNTAPFLGFNVQITGYGENMSSIQIPKINFSYAGNTVPSGYISGKLNCTSPSTPTSSAPCDIFSLTNNNGGYSDLQGLKVVFPLQSYLLDANGNAIINHQSYFFVDYEFILDDNYKGYAIITSSDNVAHTIYVNGNNFHYETFTQDPANPLTFTISAYELNRVTDPMYWNIPFESLNYINNVMSLGLEHVDYFEEKNNIQLPVFKVKGGQYISRSVYCPKDTYLYMRFYMSTDNNGNVPQGSFNMGGNFSVISWRYTTESNFKYGPYMGYVTITAYANSNTYWSLQLKEGQTDRFFIPIFCNNSLYAKNVSTDFALQFGLRNELLDNLDLLANGNNASNQSASDLQQSTDSMQDQMDDMVDIESGYNQQFNNSLNDIDFTNPIQNNAGILPAANFVITVFNGLVNNPLSILIIIICILTIGKKVIGK